MALAAIYTRISQHDPKVEKTADQESRCRTLAEREGYEVTAVFTDDGISAFSGKARPGWLSLHDAIAAERFDTVIAVAEDRLARDSIDKIGFQVHCAKHSVVWHTLSGGRVDPSTAEGSLMSTITGAIAQYESHVKRERIRASVARRVAEGKDLGGPRPFGFESDRTTIRESEAAILRGAYGALITDGSVYAATVYLNRSGARTSFGKEWGWSTVRKMLTRRRNTGILEHKGEVIDDTRPAIIDRETFDTAQAILAGLTPRTSGPKRSGLVSGVLICGRCGNTMTNGGRYYRCWEKFGTVSEARSARDYDSVHPTISRDMLERHLREQAFIRLSELAAADDGPAAGGEGEGASVEVTAARAALSEALRRRDVAQELGYMPGANMEAVRQQLSVLADQIADAGRRLDDARGRGAQAGAREIARRLIRDLGAGVSLFGGASAFAEWEPKFLALPIERQREAITSVFSSVTLSRRGRGVNRIVLERLI